MEGMVVWPGDTPFQLRTAMSRQAGDIVNLTTITISAHAGSHADAPYHFADEGITLDLVDLIPYWGQAQVVTVMKEEGPLAPSDFAAYDLTLAPRLLVRTPAGRTPDRFPERIPYPDAKLAEFLNRAGIILYGTDAPSMDALESQSLPGHRAMLDNQIAILENLDLRLAEDGLYELVALPLKIIGGDGSPIRAALRSLAD